VGANFAAPDVHLAAAGVFLTKSLWPDIIVALVITGLFLVSVSRVLRQANSGCGWQTVNEWAAPVVVVVADRADTTLHSATSPSENWFQGLSAWLRSREALAEPVAP
jgi:hypothetical protein